MKISNFKLQINISNAIQLLLSVGLIVFLTLIIGIQSTAFTGFPKGYDSFYHLGFARIISENFLNILMMLQFATT